MIAERNGEGILAEPECREPQKEEQKRKAFNDVAITSFHAHCKSTPNSYFSPYGLDLVSLVPPYQYKYR